MSDTQSYKEADWTKIFEHIIKPAIEECGFDYKCKRYSLGRANIIKDILEDLNRAQLVISDLTDNNANVLWELGVRHTLKRRTILISQDKKFIPSDLKDYPVIPYDQTKTGYDKFKEDIKEKLKDIETNPDKPDSPVADFLGLKNIDLLAHEKATNLRKLDALISELSHNISSVDDVLDQIKKSEQAREENKRKFSVSVVRFSNSCLELLLSTSYLLLPQELLRAVKLINEEMRLINVRLDLWGQSDFTQEVEKTLKNGLPTTKSHLASLLEEMGKIRTDYANDNYQEPKEPIILLASPEHEEYIKTQQ